jgi:hypothetical protein
MLFDDNIVYWTVLLSLSSNYSGAESYTSGARVVDGTMSSSPRSKIVHSHIVEQRDKSMEYKHETYRMVNFEHALQPTGSEESGRRITA